MFQTKDQVTHPHGRGFIKEPQRFQAGGACSLARARSPAPPALDYRTFPAKSFASTIGCGEKTLRKEKPSTPAGLRQGASFASSRSPARRPASTTKKSSFRTERVFLRSSVKIFLPLSAREYFLSGACLPARHCQVLALPFGRCPNGVQAPRSGNPFSSAK